jgi:hypothetical protein
LQDQLVDALVDRHDATRTTRAFRAATVGGFRPVEMIVSLALILISLALIAMIVRTVQSNLRS